MIELIRFEIKKLLSKKIVLVGIVALVIANIYLFVNYSLPNITVLTDRETNTYVQGKKALALDRAITERYAGRLTDEKVQAMLAEFVPPEEILQNMAGFPSGSGAFSVEVKFHMNSLQEAVYANFANSDGSWNGLRVQDVFGDADIEVGYNTGWLWTCSYMMQVLIGLGFLMIVVVAPVFAGEYGGMDRLILTAKYGRTKCIGAKFAASFLIAFLGTATFLLVNFGLAFLIFGAEGLDTNVAFNALLNFKPLPYEMTTQTLVVYEMLLAFTGIFAVTAVTVLVSALTKNSFIALIAALVVHVAPMLIPLSAYSPLFKYVVFFPINQGQMVALLSLGDLTTSGVQYAILAVPVVLAISIISYLVSKRHFSRHQVA